MQHSIRSWTRRAALAAGLLLSVTLGLRGAIIYVKADATGGNDGTSWQDAYTELQPALDGAVDGDEIWVAAGTYPPASPGGDRYATFLLRSGVQLYGGFVGTETDRDQRDWATNLTTLSGDLNGDDRPDFENYGDNSYHVVTADGTESSTILDGFTISAGNANGPGLDSEDDYGAGLYSDAGHPSVLNCVFHKNLADSGGAGTYHLQASPTYANCSFLENRIEETTIYAAEGGGMLNRDSHPTLTDCLFSGNTVTSEELALVRGGGMCNEDGSPTLIRCLFSGNECTEGAVAYGGGVASDGGNPLLVACTFLNNVAIEGYEGIGDGAGLHQYGGAAILVNCGFFGNEAINGGAVASEWGGSVNMTNCVLSGNYASNAGGAAFTVYGDIFLTNCTLAGNSSLYGGGITFLYTNVPATLTNTILWNNSDLGGTNEVAQLWIFYTDVAINYSCVQGWTGQLGGVGNTGFSPAFVDADGPDNLVGTEDDDLRLNLGSSCIDAGDNTAIGIDWADLDEDGDVEEPLPVDLDGQPRFADDPETADTGLGLPPIVDMGAFEFQPPTAECPGDANGDGIVDPMDSGFALARIGCAVGSGDEECDAADQNGDGLADPLDVGFILARFGPCP